MANQVQTLLDGRRMLYSAQSVGATVMLMIEFPLIQCLQ